MTWRIVERPNFELRILEGAGYDENDDNVDIEVVLPSGERFGATVFTLQNLHSLMAKFRKTGECNGGQYFWAADMIVVEKLTVQSLVEMIDDLLNSGSFPLAFQKFDDVE